MEETINYTPLSQSTQKKGNSKKKTYEKCNSCNKRRKPLDKSHHICRICYKSNVLYKPSGNKIVYDFIKYTQINSHLEIGTMEFVTFDQFKNVEFIAEGGFSKVYKATWTDGCIILWDEEKLYFERWGPMKVALKKLNHSENVSSKELNELCIDLFIMYLNIGTTIMKPGSGPVKI